MMGQLRRAVAIGAINTRRFGRDRMNILFVFIFPLALILIIGLQFGGDSTPRLGVVGSGGPTSDALRAELRSEHDIEVVTSDDVNDLRARVDSADLDAGIVLAEDLDTLVAAGDPARIGFVAGSGRVGQQLRSIVDGALATVTARPAAEQAARSLGADPDAAAEAADRLAPDVRRIEVRTVTTGDRLFPVGLGDYDVAAPSQLVLFVFITGLTGSYALIQTRQLGVSARMRSTPTSLRTIIAGESLGRLAVALIQGIYIVMATILVFGVDWGDPLGAVAVLLALGAASAGAAMCFGTFFANPDQASSIGVVVALGLGALGGAMLPIELFSDTLAAVARATPHYWALDAFAELIRHDGSILDIGRQLGVLMAYAVALLLLAAWRMRVVLTRS